MMKEKFYQTVTNGIRTQYGAALVMLKEAITSCPQELWQNDETLPPFWQIVYHNLFYLDFYLGNSKEEREKFKPFVDDMKIGPLGKKPALEALPQTHLLEYLAFIEKKAKSKFDHFSPEELTADTAFEWHGPDKFTSLIYNLRHVMLHIGALNSRLVKKGIKTTWISNHFI